MVEAVAASGYEGASVRQVVGLAGVSRRSFYEIREQAGVLPGDLRCDRGARLKQIRQAYRATEGELEDRLRPAYEAFSEGAAGRWKGARS